jgi:hypothetical protein
MVFSRFLSMTIFIPAENTRHSEKPGQNPETHIKQPTLRCEKGNQNHHKYFCKSKDRSSLLNYFTSSIKVSYS